MTLALWLIVAVFVALVVALVGGFFAARAAFRLLPKPTSFAEGQRLVYGWLAAAAGMYCGAMGTVMIALLMWGGWSKAEEHTIVVIFGSTLAGFIAAMAAVMIGLLVGGPVGRFKGDVSLPGGTKASFEAEDDAAASLPSTPPPAAPIAGGQS